MSENFLFDHVVLESKSQVSIDEEEPFESAITLVREKLGERFTPEIISTSSPSVMDATKGIGADVYAAYNDKAITKMKKTIPMAKDIFIERVMAEMHGLGPIQPLLEIDSIEDIAVNGPNEVYTLEGAQWKYQPGLSYSSAQRMLQILNNQISSSNRSVNEATPIADAILKKEERISIVTHPICKPYPVCVIRMPHSIEISLEDFVKPYKAPGQTDLQAAKSREDMLNAPPEKTPLPDYARLPQGGMLTVKAAQYLHAAVLAGLNIIVIGPTGVGKTTMLRALGKIIPEDNRILIIEDTPEIILYPKSDRPHNVINLRTRPKTVGERLEPITQNELVILALRQRPDALTLGEARGEEILSLLTALNTGHRNGLTSIHTERPEELFRRIVTMLSQNDKARNMSEYTAASLVSKTLNIVVALEIYGRTRRVASIFEFNGKISGSGHNAEPDMQEMFISYGGGAASSLTGPVNPSVFADKFFRLGVDKNIFSPE